jgi:hypothetical protein
MQVQIGVAGGRRAHGIDHDHLSGRFRQPVLVLVRRRRRWIRSPHQDAVRVAGGARVKAVERRAVQVIKRDVPGLVAKPVRVDLRCSKAVEKAQSEEVAEQRERARLVRVQNRVGARIGRDPGQAFGDLAQGLVPADLGVASGALRPAAPQGCQQPRGGIAQHPAVRRRAHFTHSRPRLTGWPRSPRTWRIAPSRLTTATPHAS